MNESSVTADRLLLHNDLAHPAIRSLRQYLPGGFRTGVCVLNYNGSVETLPCVRQLIAAAQEPRMIAVLDNCSSPEDSEHLQRGIESLGDPVLSVEIPGLPFGLSVAAFRCEGGHVCVLCRTSLNVGFCTGNNLLVELVAALDVRFALILNNDAMVTGGCIERLADTAEETGAGAVSPHIFDRDGNTWYAGGDYNWLGYHYIKKPISDTEPFTTRVYSGCAVLFPVSRYLQLGGMCDALFVCLDEPEFANRLLVNGLEIYVDPRAKVTHLIGGTLGRSGSPLHDYFWIRNRYFFSKCINDTLRHAGFVSIYSAVRASKWLYFTLSGQWRRIPMESRAVGDFLLRRVGPGSLAKRLRSLPHDGGFWGELRPESRPR